jgi:hypothetical protein
MQLLGAHAQRIVHARDFKARQWERRKIIAAASFARHVAILADNHPRAIHPGFAIWKMFDANQIIGEDADLQTFASPASKNKRMRGRVGQRNLGYCGKTQLISFLWWQCPT